MTEEYLQLISDMITIKQEHDFLLHIDEIEKTGEFISLEESRGSPTPTPLEVDR